MHPQQFLTYIDPRIPIPIASHCQDIASTLPLLVLAMASTKPTSLAVAVSLVVVLFASISPCAQATFPPQTVPPVSFVNVTFVNNLTQTLSVTIGAPPLGTPQSTTIAPGATGMLPVDVVAPLLVQDILQFRVNGTLYIDTASGPAGALGRLVALVGVLSIVVVNGPCSTGQEGLILMDYAAGTLINPMGCAVRQ